MTFAPGEYRFVRRRAELLSGEEGEETKALRKRTPSFAMRSKFGVRMISFALPGPLSAAYAEAWRPQSSAKRRTMFGRSAPWRVAVRRKAANRDFISEKMEVEAGARNWWTA